MAEEPTPISRAETLRLIREDCRNDASVPTPFTALGIGTMFGNVLAMIDTLARLMEEDAHG